MNNHIILYVFGLLILFLVNSHVLAVEQTSVKDVPSTNERVIEDEDVLLRFISLSSQQIGSFYEGREFDKAAVTKLMSSCYVTVIITNKTNDILWLDLDAWTFNQNGQSFKRQTRAYWDRQWDEIGLTQAHRSTFGWTLMPDVRNLYTNESVGGRIPVPMQSKTFSVTLNFPTGANKQGKEKSIKVDDMSCD